MSATDNQIINPEGRIQFSRDQMISSFVEVQEAPKSLMGKLTGEMATKSKFIHLFSSYIVKPVACDKYAGTRFTVKQPGAEKTAQKPRGPQNEARNLQRWNRGGEKTEQTDEARSGGPGKFFTNSSVIKIPANLSVKEQMEYLVKLQEEKMLKEQEKDNMGIQMQPQQEEGDKPNLSEEVKDEPPKEETDVPISTLLTKMDEAEEVKAPKVEVEATVKVAAKKNKNKNKKAAEEVHPPAPEVEDVKAEVEKVEPPPKQKAAKKQKQKQQDVQKSQQQEVKAKPEQVPEEEENAWMAESVAETEEKPAQTEDLATIRDKLAAVKQAIAKIEDPAAAETPELYEELYEEPKPKALTKNEKRKLAKQRQRAKQQQYIEEQQSEDDEEEEAYVIKQRPKVSGPAPVVPENIAKRDTKTSLKMKVGNIQDTGSTTTVVDGVTLSSKVAQSKNKNVNPEEQKQLAQNNYFVQGQKFEMDSSASPKAATNNNAQTLDDIMYQQEKQEKHNKIQRKQQIEEQKQENKKTDMRFLFDESSKKPQKPKFAAKIDVAPQDDYYRDDIVEARQKLSKQEDLEKKQDEYYINSYGIKKLVNPPPKPKVEKVKGGKKKGINLQPAPSRVVQASDSDSDETAEAKKQLAAASGQQTAQEQPPKEQNQGKKKGKNKKGAAAADPQVEVPAQKKKKSSYDSEDDSDDDELSFIPKSLQKKKKEADAPMSKRQQKKLGESSLAGMVKKSSLKQQLSHF